MDSSRCMLKKGARFGNAAYQTQVIVSLSRGIGYLFLLSALYSLLSSLFSRCKGYLKSLFSSAK
jgi:hypothetical protein